MPVWFLHHQFEVLVGGGGGGEGIVRRKNSAGRIGVGRMVYGLLPSSEHGAVSRSFHSAPFFPIIRPPDCSLGGVNFLQTSSQAAR